MAVTVYRSTDSSAPTLSGTVGSLIALLDACLVNGYGSQPAAGWTKEYTGTNLAAYRMSTTSPATGFYLRIDDTGTTSSRLVGYETMSDVNTGTGQFPTSGQVSGGGYLWKSGTANSTARPWTLIADTRGFYLYVCSNSTTYGSDGRVDYDSVIFFGDIVTRKATDGYECVLITPTAASGYSNTLGLVSSQTSTSLQSYHYIARQYTGVGGSTQVGKCRVTRWSWNVQNNTIGYSMPATLYPDKVTNVMDASKIMIFESGGAVMRGYMPGMYELQGGTNIAGDYQLITGAGPLTGVTLLQLPALSGSYLGRMAIQANGSWY